MRESVKVLIRQNRMWENPEVRAEFERELGFGPLPKLDSDEWDEWWLSGDLQRYHDGFYEWSRIRAQGIEAGTATTPKSGVVHESPVAEGDAPNPEGSHP